MPDIPGKAVQAATEAVTKVHCKHTLGWACAECRARAALEAAAPFIAAPTLISERRRAVALVRATLVPVGCEPTQDAKALIEAITGDLPADDRPWTQQDQADLEAALAHLGVTPDDLNTGTD